MEEGDKFIRENSEKPFFLMMSLYAVHSPLQGKPGKVARYEKVPEEQRQGDPRYAAMVETVDDIFQVINEAPTPGHRSPEDHL